MVNAQFWVYTSGYGALKQKVDNNESLYSAAPCEQHICDLQQQNILQAKLSFNAIRAKFQPPTKSGKEQK